MKKIIPLIMLCLILSFRASAMDVPNTPMPDTPRENMPMMQMTEEQKKCIESFGCPQMEKPEIPARPEKSEKTDMKNKPEIKDKPEMKGRPETRDKPERKEMTDSERESMECMRKAMESCGIQMPTPPEHLDNKNVQKPELPVHNLKTIRPERETK